MDDAICITELNDFVFCPVSIYFHKLYGTMEKMTFQSTVQLNGSAAHKKVDEGTYSTKKNMLMGTDVYCEKYRLIGKIDLLDIDRRMLRERKKKIKQIYDGYVYQVYAQYFALKEMGYEVEKIEIYSMDNHQTYAVKRPEEDVKMFYSFERTIESMHSFDMDAFRQTNIAKCKHCIYEPACDRSLLTD